jgi:hypothetical protein
VLRKRVNQCRTELNRCCYQRSCDSSSSPSKVGSTMPLMRLNVLQDLGLRRRYSKRDGASSAKKKKSYHNFKHRERKDHKFSFVVVNLSNFSKLFNDAFNSWTIYIYIYVSNVQWVETAEWWLRKVMLPRPDRTLAFAASETQQTFTNKSEDGS